MQVNAQHDVDLENDELTEQERAELDADTASGGAPTETKEAEQPPAVEDPDAATAARIEAAEDATARAMASISETQAQTAAILADIAAAKSPTAAPAAVDPETPAVPVEPDWDAERKALRAKYDEGELDDDAYEQERENLIERKAEWKADQRASQIVEQRLQAEANAQSQRWQEARDQEWDAALKSFMDDKANAPILTNSDRNDVLNVMLQKVSNENPTAPFDAMFAEAAARTRKLLNLPGAEPDQGKQQQAAVAKAVAARQPTSAPPDMSRAPQAGMGNDRGDEFADLDNMDVDDLENRLARMSEADVLRYLETAPGGLLDNPRGV